VSRTHEIIHEHTLSTQGWSRGQSRRYGLEFLDLGLKKRKEMNSDIRILLNEE
jgi:hypothetical protein